MNMDKKKNDSEGEAQMSGMLFPLVVTSNLIPSRMYSLHQGVHSIDSVNVMGTV